jgi:hypothetical protein
MTGSGRQTQINRRGISRSTPRCLVLAVILVVAAIQLVTTTAHRALIADGGHLTIHYVEGSAWVAMASSEPTIS